MSQLSSIMDLGFKKIGSWSIAQGNLIFDLFKHKDKTDILYAFVSGDKVFYIGKSTQSVYRRMMGYKNPGPTQKTNIRNSKNLSDVLSKGMTVDIYVLVDEEPFMYRGYRISLAAGLEDELISRIKPEWNLLSRT